MAYDEDLANRLRERVQGEVGVSEKRMFGGVAFLLWAGLGGRQALLVCALTVLLGALDETRQMFVPGRDPDLHDLYADGLGATAVLAFLEAITAPRALPAPAPFASGD